MSKKKVTLEEAKRILDSDKVFYNGKTKFNVLDVGKYNSGITIEIPQEWTLSSQRSPESPINYITNKELTDGMNVDFDGSASFLLGKYRLSKNGKPVFELTEPTKATDALIRIGWGGAFNSTRGQDRDYAQETGATFFTSRSSNGGRLGNDYWVLPVNFVKDMEPRDVSQILKTIEQKENERISNIDSYLEQQDKQKQTSINNRDKVLTQLKPIMEQMKLYNPNFDFKAEKEALYYKTDSSYWFMSKDYSDQLIQDFTELLEKFKLDKLAYEEYLPKYKSMEYTIREMNIIIEYNSNFVSVYFPNYSSSKSYFYNSSDYNSFITDITKHKEKIDQENEEIRKKAEELKRATELKKLKEDAKIKGYPENFEFRNRLYGKASLSHAYVISHDGIIREPDYNNLSNYNHRHKYSDWKNLADGTQGYYQILPGEIIVTYTKGYSAVPYILNVEWADREITPPQLEVICDLLDEKTYFAEDSVGHKITDIKKWVTNVTKSKYKECIKQLNLEGPISTNENNEEFAEEIVEYAKQKFIERDKNAQAKELAKAYEQHYQDSLEVPSNE